MKSQEIKSLLPPTPYRVDNSIEIRDGKDCLVATSSSYAYLGKNDMANAAAICLSVNHTFGANIDPVKVPEMYLLLKAIKTGLENEQEKTPMTKLVIIQIDALLTSAKLD